MVQRLSILKKSPMKRSGFKKVGHLPGQVNNNNNNNEIECLFVHLFVSVA